MSNFYIEDPKKYVKKFYSKKQVSIEVILNELEKNPEFANKIKAEMKNYNEEKQRKVSYASSRVSQKTRSKAGKIASKTGRKNLEKARTPEHQSKAGKAAGKINVKSGHWAKVIKLGAQAAKEKYAKLRKEKLEKITSKMEKGKEYTKKELITLCPDVKNASGIISCEDACNYLNKRKAGRGGAWRYSIKSIK